MSDALEIAMFESGWFGSGPAFWRWVVSSDAAPYRHAFVQMHAPAEDDEPFDLLGSDGTSGLLDPDHLKELASHIQSRYGEGATNS